MLLRLDRANMTEHCPKLHTKSVWGWTILVRHLSSTSARYVLIFWLTGIAAASTALLVGCIASNAEVAQQAAPAVT